MLYADTITPSMHRAMDETERRRQIQDDYNKAHGIIPQTIRKDVREIIEISKKDEESARRRGKRKLSERERDEEIRKLEKQMKPYARIRVRRHPARPYHRAAQGKYEITRKRQNL